MPSMPLSKCTLNLARSVGAYSTLIKIKNSENSTGWFKQFCMHEHRTASSILKSNALNTLKEGQRTTYLYGNYNHMVLSSVIVTHLHLSRYDDVAHLFAAGMSFSGEEV